MSGTVYAVGEGVDDLKPGDRVVVEPYILRPDVDTSENNPTYHLSPDMNFIGLGGRGGGLAEKIVVERRWVHPVGDVPLDQAALIEPLSVGYHAFQRSGAKAGDFALVGGAGPIGLLTCAVLKAMGIQVAVTELSSLRRRRPWTPGSPTTSSTPPPPTSPKRYTASPAAGERTSPTRPPPSTRSSTP